LQEEAMPHTLTDAEANALENKRAFRRNLVVDIEDPLEARARAALIPKPYDNYAVGTFIAIENIRLEWVAPDYFAFIPKHTPFAFRRASGDTITPRHMFTDGGSIPRIFQPLRHLSPWTYGPAYLLHDWLFDVHHCKGTGEFETVRDILMEAIKTMMETAVGGIRKDVFAFQEIYLGVDSIVAKQIWNKTGPCPLPPDIEE
jgi:hypothetical protein